MVKEQRLTLLALMKIGLSEERALELSQVEALGWLELYGTLLKGSPPQGKTYRVRRRATRG